MAPTFRHSKNAYLAMVVSGTTTLLSTSFDDSALNRTVDSAEVTVYTQGDKAYLAGLRGGTVPIGGMFDKTVAGLVEAQLGAATNPTFKYGPEGNTATRRLYTFGAVITQWDVMSPLHDKVGVKGQLQISGAVTSTTF